jgi:cytochrome c-type biogenesis protein
VKITGPSIAAVLGVLALHGAGLTAQSGGVDHSAHLMPTAAFDSSALDFTVNVGISDGGIQPSAVFVPAGRPVQLVLRDRGSTEHHYRVVGLVPDELLWMADGTDGGSTAPAAEHDHHNHRFVNWRAVSPAGIRPTGREVHAYVWPDRRLDAVFFTATQTGTYVVQCDLHPDETGRLTVFDAGSSPIAAAAPRFTPALARALTKDLGSVDHPGAAGVRVEATYAPAEYVNQILGAAAADVELKPDHYVGVLLSERTHTANLPDVAAPPDLTVNGDVVPLIDRRIVADSPHHRATVYRFARDASFGAGHQMMTLRLASGQEATWHLPLMLPDIGDSTQTTAGFRDQWALILALLGGMLAAMWPCLFQLTVYFIPALAGVAMQDSGASDSRRRQVLSAAFYFILGFTLIYTATGALIGYAAGRLGDTGQFEAWQRYIGVAAGIVVLGLALRVAAKVRVPLVCRMPVLSRMAHSNKPATRLEMMVAGLAFATGCMTCFGSALVVGMVVYVGLAESALYGALVLFLFSLGMGIPLVIAAVAMARALPLLLKLESAVPWMGLVSALLMAGFGALLISGNYMVVSEWTFRVVSGSASVPNAGNLLVPVSAVAGTFGFVGWLIWMISSGRARKLNRMASLAIEREG